MSGHFLKLTIFGALLTLGAACSESSVGDPCVPEQVPEGGFLDSETYLETSSVQCATRVCLVRNLDGDPNFICEELTAEQLEENPELANICVSEEQRDDNVYCSCRCDAPEGSSVPTCGCPGGFLCEEILETGGNGIRGSYCVRDPALAAEPNEDDQPSI